MGDDGGERRSPKGARRVAAVATFIAIGAAVSTASADDLQDARARESALAWSEARKTSVEGAAFLQSGDMSLSRGDFDAALGLFQKAAKLMPQSDYAQHRICDVEIMRRKRQEALAACEQAVKLADKPTNNAALATALAMPGAGAVDLDRALAVSETAAKEGGVLEVYVHCAVLQGTKRDVLSCARRFVELAPDTAQARLLAAREELGIGKRDVAAEHLAIARELGAPAAEVDELEAKLCEEPEPPPPRGSNLPASTLPLLLFLAGWATAIALVAAVAGVLGVATAHWLAALPPNAPLESLAQRRLSTRLYRGALWLVCGLLYLTLPILTLGLGWLTIAFATSGTMKQRVVMAVILALPLVAAVALLVRSVTVRSVEKPPGEEVDLADHPELDEILEEVASTIGTRKVDRVFFSPYAELSMVERTTIGDRILGRQGERCLVIGIGILRELSLLELKALLASEHAQFVDRPGSSGPFASVMRRAFNVFADSLAQKDLFGNENLAGAYANVLRKTFDGVSHGAIRLHRVLSDRAAAAAYGASSVGRGLERATRLSVTFQPRVESRIKRATLETPVKNLYRLPEPSKEAAAKAAAAVHEVMTRPGHDQDGGITPSSRIEWVRGAASPVPEDVQEDAGREAWSVFDDRKALERHYTRALLEQAPEKLGVDIDVETGAPRKVRGSRGAALADLVEP